LEESASRGWVPLQLWYILVLELWLRHERLPDSGPVRPRVNRFDLEPRPDSVADSATDALASRYTTHSLPTHAKKT